METKKYRRLGWAGTGYDPRTSRRGYQAVLLAIGLLLPVLEARAGVVTNGNGWGVASVAVWCKPNKPPAAPSHSFTTQFGPAPFAFAGPNLAGCNPNTSVWVNSAGLPNLRVWSGYQRAAGGDITSADDDDLLKFVTPVSEDASGDLYMTGTVISDMVEFEGYMTNSDSGVAQRIEWLDMTDPDEPELLGSLLFVGQGASGLTEPIDMSIPIPSGGLDYLEVHADMLATSLPEPTTVAMLVIGGLGALLRRRF